jgi:S-adenosylmethionine-diacylgycerolhomoserine-N-methlytransferase
MGAEALERYYRWHARIYDATRWSFLFGRSGILDLAAREVTPRSILEIGCGTGAVLVSAAKRFPEARIVGIDLSEDMLKVAKRRVSRFGERVRLHHGAYDGPAAARLGEPEGFDLILFSYALSMFGDAAERAAQHAASDLSPRGRLAAVDFHHAGTSWFERWMGMNHVRMRGHALAALTSAGLRGPTHAKRAYAGIWSYMSFVGAREAAEAT